MHKVQERKGNLWFFLEDVDEGFEGDGADGVFANDYAGRSIEKLVRKGNGPQRAACNFLSNSGLRQDAYAGADFDGTLNCLNVIEFHNGPDGNIVSL